MQKKSKTYNRSDMPIARMPDAFEAQNQKGRRQAICLIAIMRAHGAPFMLGRTVGRMIEDGRFGGEEIGFCQTIGEACL